MVKKAGKRPRRRTAKHRRALRKRRATYRAKRQRGGSGDIPDDLNTVVVRRDGNDIDSVETPVSKEVFDEESTASPEAAV